MTGGAALLAPAFAADDDGVAGDLQAGSVGKSDFSVQVVAHRSGGKLPRGSCDGLPGDNRCDFRSFCDELRFAHGFIGFVVGINHRGHRGHGVDKILDKDLEFSVGRPGRP